MKNVLLIICALGYGVLPAMAAFQNAILIVLFPILLGLIYFVFYRHVWPPRLVPWLFACAAVGRVAAYWWMNLRHRHAGPVVDSEVWVFGGLAAVSFAYTWWKWMTRHTETSTSASPKSM
jgi:hypothetical protein